MALKLARPPARGTLARVHCGSAPLAADAWRDIQAWTGTPRVQKVKEITDKLVKEAVRVRPDSASWSWEVQVIDDPKTVNAFCMAGGKMAIYTGMWDQLKATDDEIAQVMGHEIAHALADHTRERMSIAMTTAVATTAAAIDRSTRDSPPGPRSPGRSFAAVLAIQLPNSRERIRGRPDRHQLAARAGYDPKAAVTLWEKMGKLGGGKGPPEFLSTHPSPENRAVRLAELGAQMPVPPREPRKAAGRQADRSEVKAKPFPRLGWRSCRAAPLGATTPVLRDARAGFQRQRRGGHPASRVQQPPGGQGPALLPRARHAAEARQPL
jgi:predicted Zn-dependent protease